MFLSSANQKSTKTALVTYPQSTRRIPATTSKSSSSGLQSIEQRFENAFQRGLKGHSFVIHISTPVEKWDTSEVGKHGIDLQMAKQLKARKIWLSKQESALKNEMEKDPNAITRLKAMGGKFAKRIDFVLAALKKKMDAAKESETKEKHVAALKQSSIHNLKQAKCALFLMPSFDSLTIFASRWNRELRKLDNIIVNSGGSYKKLRKDEDFSSDVSSQSSFHDECPSYDSFSLFSRLFEVKQPCSSVKRSASNTDNLIEESFALLSLGRTTLRRLCLTSAIA
eukprot:766462-Hanusia_phi.AAC.13